MGCAQSKQATNEPAEPVNQERPPAAPIPEVDPRLPLNAKEIFSLKMSWKGVQRCMEETGAAMMLRYYEANPNAWKKVTTFKDLSSSTIATNTDFEEHTAKLMECFDMAMTSLQNADPVIKRFEQVGRIHRKLGLEKAELQAIEGPLLDSIRVTLGDRYTDRMDEIYRRCVKFLIDTLLQGWEKGDSEPEDEQKDGQK